MRISKINISSVMLEVQIFENIKSSVIVEELLFLSIPLRLYHNLKTPLLQRDFVYLLFSLMNVKMFNIAIVKN